MTRWMQVAQRSEIEHGKSKVVKLGDERVAVFNADGKFYAINNTCPHQGGPLGEGVLDGESITCPWHEWKYDLKTGCPIVTPAVKTYALQIDGEAIWIAVDPKAESPDQQDKVTFEGEETTDPVYEILEQINLGKTLDEVFENIYVGLQAVVPHSRLGIALIDESSGRLVQVKTKSDRKIVLDNGFSARIAGSTLEGVLESGEARIIDDFREVLEKRPSVWTRLMVEEGMRSNLTLPLKVSGKPIGVVFFTSAIARAFSEAHVGFLKQIAGQLSILIEKGRWVSDLAQSNARYRTLFEMSNDAIFICPSLSQPFVTVNENLCVWLGYTHQELSSLSLHDLMREEEFRRVSQLLEKLLPQGTPIAFETELSKRDEGTLPLGMRVVGIEHGGERFIQGFARDLSEVKALNEQLKSLYTFENLIGKNRQMQEIYELIQQVAPMSTTVLIQGESGTGKELVAKAIHHQSERTDKAFVSVNCGALAESLLESELFGHVKGAYTGATTTRQGRFEIADKGTVFLDEIGDLSPAMQVKLLRVLQEGSFEKVGSSRTQKVDVRIIAASNRDLKAAIESGDFREDLYYRLNIVPIQLPPLRERRDDIPLLIEHFIQKFNRHTQRSIQDISPEALNILMEYAYPGNVRQLENIIEHAFVKCPGEYIEKKHLPTELIGPKDDIVTLVLMGENPLAALEQELIQRVLEQCNGKPKLAAKRLGISRTTLWRRLKAEK